MKDLNESKIKDITDTLAELEYGSIVITVHDGTITQVDTTEKKRFSIAKKKERERKIK